MHWITEWYLCTFSDRAKSAVLFASLRIRQQNRERVPLTDEGDASEQMGPYVGGLRVYPEDAPEAGPEAGQRRPMAVGEEIVVLQPYWKMLEMTHGPTDLYQLSNYMFRLTGRVLGQRRNI